MTEQQLGRLLIYQNEKGDTRIDVYFEDENIWLTQSAFRIFIRCGCQPSTSISKPYWRTVNCRQRQLLAIS